jgi:drug/metabolite transporter (DMT)-like permease
MRPREWVWFIALGLIWGSSFLWIKIAVQEIDPFTLVGWRVLFGALGMLVVLFVRRPEFPRQPSTWLAMVVMGMINTALPFTLISWGEQTIDSAVASILNSTVPLFTLLIAHYFLHDDRITIPKLVGLAVGFLGILTLLGRDLQLGGFHAGALGQAAVLLAAISYASASVFGRRTMHEVSPVVQAFVPMLAANVVVWSVATQVGQPGTLPALPITWLALLWLGLLGSCVAYLLYFNLLHTVGATRTTMVTYVFPVVGVALGVLFLGETADWHLVVGALLVVSSIAIVNRAPRPEAASVGAD